MILCWVDLEWVEMVVVGLVKVMVGGDWGEVD